MILSYDTDTKDWVFQSNNDFYFFEETDSDLTKQRNILAEFPIEVSDDIKIREGIIKVKEIRYSIDVAFPQRKFCRWVRFSLFYKVK